MNSNGHKENRYKGSIGLVMSEEKKKYGLKICGYLVFIGYLLALIYFMFFSDFYGRTQVSAEYHYNLRPFKEIIRFVKYYKTIGVTSALLNLVGNVIGFLPFGFFVPTLFKRARRWYIVLLFSMEFSIIIELLQLINKVGSCDVDDVILNTLGGLLGYFCYCVIQYVRRKSNG